jgi:hypothetical protein
VVLLRLQQKQAGNPLPGENFLVDGPEGVVLLRLQKQAGNLLPGENFLVDAPEGVVLLRLQKQAGNPLPGENFLVDWSEGVVCRRVSVQGIRHCRPQPSALFSTDRQRPSPTRHFSKMKTRISYGPFHKQPMEY